MKFRVEKLLDRGANVAIFARRLEAGDFSVSAASQLGGFSILPIVEDVRKLRNDGDPDLDVCGFVLSDKKDAANLSIGQIVDLEP